MTSFVARFARSAHAPSISHAARECPGQMAAGGTVPSADNVAAERGMVKGPPNPNETCAASA